jgi:hypothetical protein
MNVVSYMGCGLTIAHMDHCAEHACGCRWAIVNVTLNVSAYQSLTTADSPIAVFNLVSECVGG